MPPLRLRPQGLATLVLLIIQQQVSRSSAQAVFGRLEELIAGPMTAASVASLTPEELRAIGFSQQKADYVITLAESIAWDRFDLAGLADMDDDAAIAALRSHRGIGPWTASVYVLTALGRPDIWAPGDRALLVSLGRMLSRPDAPTNEEAVALAASWAPWRAVAARILWHDYSASEVR